MPGPLVLVPIVVTAGLATVAVVAVVGGVGGMGPHLIHMSQQKELSDDDYEIMLGLPERHVRRSDHSMPYEARGRLFTVSCRYYEHQHDVDVINQVCNSFMRTISYSF
jgi:hypothetical protein